MLKYFLLIFLSLNMFSFEILPKKDIKIDSWRFIKDQVMGGKSDGFMLLKESQNQEFDFISAKGNVSTDGGGFLMFYASDKEKLRSKMKSLKINELDFKFDFEGTKIL